MSLRVKALLVLLGVFAIFAAFVYAIHSMIFIPHFLSLERAELMRSMDRCEGLVERELDFLQRMSGDYGSWDETYDYVETRSQEYIDSNFVPSTYSGSDLSLICLVGVDGEILFSKGYDPEEDELVDPPADILREVVAASRLTSDDYPDTVKRGLLATQAGAVLVVSCGILHSDKTGPLRGCIIMVRPFSEDVIDKIADVANASFSVLMARAEPAASSAIALLLEARERGGEAISEVGGTRIAVLRTLRGMDGLPVMHLCVDMPRTILAGGQREARFAMMTVLAGGLIVMLIMLVLLESQVIRRLACINEAVKTVQATRDPAFELDSEGADEIGDVARELNAMLSELHAAQEERQESQERYGALFRQMLNGLAICEPIYDESGSAVDYRYLEVNPAYEGIVRRPADEIVGLTGSELVPQDYKNMLSRIVGVAETGEPAHYEIEIQSLGLHLAASAFLHRQGQVVVILRDITERRRNEEQHARLQAQIQQTQKLDSLGVLAGGIAHDFNNLLMGILGNAELAIEDVGKDSPVRVGLEEIVTAAKRAAELCGQMLAYSGRGQFVVEAVDLNVLIQGMTQLINVSISKKAHLELELADDLPLIEGDVTQTRQILMNLIINASESLGEDTGTISVRTGTMACDAAFLASSYVDDGLPAGDYVFVDVADSGSGMNDETLRRIFDPFFTTKFTGRGLGLGAVMGIVRGHRGAIRVESEVGKGTTFCVLLPASTITAEPPSSMEAFTPYLGSGTVLLVDDEPAVLHAVSEMLRRIGFKVVSAADGVEAVQVFETRLREIVCVVLDMTMPVMGGEETFKALRQIKPEIPVIVSSGYDEAEMADRFGDETALAFIHKPYQRADLQRVLHVVLDGSDGAGNTS